MTFFILPLIVIAWITIPGALIGWVAGFFNWHLYTAILWGIIILITYPRAKIKDRRKIDLFTIFLALLQAGAGGAFSYFIGDITH